ARCLEAAEMLATSGFSAGVLHVPCLKPVDAAAILAAARGVRLVVTVEEHTILGGVGGLVAEILTEHEPRAPGRIGIAAPGGEPSGAGRSGGPNVRRATRWTRSPIRRSTP